MKKFQRKYNSEIRDSAQWLLNSISNKGNSLVVYGYGSGHGVGMSQWGARYMANQGKDASRILKHFYKGVEIKPFKKYFL